MSGLIRKEMLRKDLLSNDAGKGVDLVHGAAKSSDLSSSDANKGGSLVGFKWNQLAQSVEKIDWGIQTGGNGLNVLRYITPAEWPAILNGTSTYDCTVSIQTAIDSAATIIQNVIASKSDIVTSSVYVPSGIFKHTGTIYVKEGVRLVGASRSSSVFISDGIAVAVQLGNTDREYSNVVLENITVKGNGSTNTTKGVRFVRCIRTSYIKNCQIFGFGYNIYGEQTWAFQIVDNFIHDALKNNIYWADSTACEIHRNRIDGAGEEGIVIDGQSSSELINVRVSGNAIQGCNYNGVKVIDATNVTFRDNFFESNNQAASTYANVLLFKGSRGQKTTVANFTGNFYTAGSAGGTTHRAIDIRSAEQVFIIGDQVRGSKFDRAILGSNDVGYAYVRGVFDVGGSNPIDFDSATVLDWVNGNFQKVIGESPSAIGKSLSIKDAKANQPLIHFENSSSDSGSVTLQAKAGTSDTNTFLAYWLNSSGSNVFRVFSNGDTKNLNNVFGAISDEKLKTDIVDAQSQWNDIKNVRLRKYRLKSDPCFMQLGVVAQELEITSPGLVGESPDFEEVEIVKENGSTEFERRLTGTTTKDVKYSLLYLKAVGALQEAMLRIEQLEKKFKVECK